MSNSNSGAGQVVPPGRPQKPAERVAEHLVGVIARQSPKIRLLLAAWALFFLWMGWYLAQDTYDRTFAVEG